MVVNNNTCENRHLLRHCNQKTHKNYQLQAENSTHSENFLHIIQKLAKDKNHTQITVVTTTTDLTHMMIVFVYQKIVMRRPQLNRHCSE